MTNDYAATRTDIILQTHAQNRSITQGCMTVCHGQNDMLRMNGEDKNFSH